MVKATDALLKDHLLIRKTMENFHLDNPRFVAVAKTLGRILIAHAWFEDQIFLPALKAEKWLDRLSREISAEHQDIDELFRRVRLDAQAPSLAREGTVLQLRSIIETHFRKEEDALFPLTERILDSEGLNHLGDEMIRRKAEVRDLGV